MVYDTLYVCLDHVAIIHVPVAQSRRGMCTALRAV